MTGSSTGSPDDPDDVRLEHSLEHGLQRARLSPQALARIRHAVEAEFRLGTRRPALRWPVWAVAASVLMVVVAAAFLLSARQVGPVVASVTRVDAGDLSASVGLFRGETLRSGSSVRSGQNLEAHGAALVALEGGGVLRIAPGSRVSFNARDELELLDGRVYFDSAAGAAAFRVRFGTGTVEHIGTQFEVLALDGGARVRVREGSIRLRNSRDIMSAAAGTELVVTAAGDVTRKSVPTYGADWVWVESIAPDYELENHPLADFLTWVARETGRHVEFVDAHAREVALRTQVHGSVHGLAPLEALNRVLSTTTLRFELDGDVIRVSSVP